MPLLEDVLCGIHSYAWWVASNQSLFQISRVLYSKCSPNFQAAAEYPKLKDYENLWPVLAIVRQNRSLKRDSPSGPGLTQISRNLVRLVSTVASCVHVSGADAVCCTPPQRPPASGVPSGQENRSGRVRANRERRSARGQREAPASSNVSKPGLARTVSSLRCPPSK